jgi:lysophospholipase L1-like esterase
MVMEIMENEVVLFQGDSVTDVGRDREDLNSLVNGYPMMIAAWLAASFPEKQITFINKGISGDRVRDLRKRWEADCLGLQPTLVSILIGINDCWRRYDRNDPTSAEKFEADYRFILDQVKERTAAKIILCEPFVLPVPEDRKAWREDLDPKINVVRDLAREYRTLLIPLDGIFNSMEAFKAPEFWLRDGVHPTPAGHALIAREWMKRMECL